jgi:tripeptide aminopeptidase
MTMQINIQDFVPDIEDRFLRYVKVDTQADEKSPSVPSTAIQFDLLNLLADELREMGASDVTVAEYGCVFATIPSTVDFAVPTIAFMAHVDTAPAFHASGVKPIVHRKYNGEPITLPDDPSQVLSPDDFPFLRKKVGEDIVTASGTTLLGADDKAGIAAIMAMAKYFLNHPEVPHGKIRIVFTTDEEIGRGVRHVKLEDVGAAYAYTLDGGDPGELTYETFSADKAVVTITGVSTHPGTAFGVLVNALTLAAKFISFLPEHTRTPETTNGRQGFIHLYSMQGTAAVAELNFILRDFELDGLQAHGDVLRAAAQALALAEPRAKINVNITPQYRNMRYWLENDLTPVNLAETAIRRAGLEPVYTPVRGGTDGSQFTERGLPTPNLFTGMQNVHGPLEYVSLQDIARATHVCIELAQLWSQHATESSN